ncbi:MAG: lipopolysaccharide heptosyltransferase II [bacterium]|nr:lipopolysaccharide heptosyltransferase II [bacterium]
MPPRILVVQTAFLGDLVLTTPLVRALRKKYPEAHIGVLAIPTTGAILERLPELDCILVHDKRGGGLKELVRILRAVRREKFDTVISPHRSTRSTLISSCSGAKRRIGYKENELSFFYNYRVNRPMQKNEAERILALLEPLGGCDESPVPHLELTDIEVGEARALMGDGHYALVAPGSAWATKRWLPDYFVEVAVGLEQRGYRVALVGGSGDVETAEEVAGKLPDSVANLAGRTTVRQLAALVAEAGVLVCNDSAPVHIASAFDTPTVAIFGATTPGMGFAPLGERSLAVGIPGLTCRPCGDHGSESCPEGHFACMKQLSSETVLEAVDRVR